MGKFEKKTGSTAAVLSAVVVLAVVLVIALWPRGAAKEPVLFPDGSGIGASDGSTAPLEGAELNDSDATEGTVPVACQLPMLLENGMLEVNNLFQTTGINPDQGNQEGTDIATLALKNNAGSMLKKATVTATLNDGTEILFQATNLPAGKTALAFSSDSISLPGDAVCVSIVCEAQWDESSQNMPQGISASAEGMMVTVTNDTEQDIPELIVYCRTPLGEEYFGGMAYEYTINDLPANGSTTFVATDCIVGLAEVVKIEIKEG